MEPPAIEFWSIAFYTSEHGVPMNKLEQIHSIGSGKKTVVGQSDGMVVINNSQCKPTEAAPSLQTINWVPTQQLLDNFYIMLRCNQPKETALHGTWQASGFDTMTYGRQNRFDCGMNYTANNEKKEMHLMSEGK
jgi:hypothetical protein